MVSPAAPALPDVARGATRTGGVEDRYCSLFLVGRGGMGTVEVALERGREGFERIVALKRLLPDQARDPRHKQMFLGEARLAALLRHPNVVHAFAFGDLYGELFLAMEYVEGETLSRTLEALGRGMDPVLVAFVLAEVCEGLHAAHELRDEGGAPLRVVHRDVSPQNVMIAYDGHIKILDFGVAKFDAGGNESRTGEVKGKMAYMSPEQALGEKLDRRSNLYSLGAVLFECLTGRRMWGGGTDLEVMRKLALEEPPRLDASVPGMAPAMVDLHARLVARKPDSRPATALEVARELRAFAGAAPAATTESVRAMMHRLFVEDAARRTEEMDAALASAAPGEEAHLRRTLDLGATVDGETRTEALIVASERNPVSSTARPGPRAQGRRGPAVLGVTIFIAGAAVATAVVTARAPPPSPAPATAALNVAPPTAITPSTSATSAAPATSAVAAERSAAPATASTAAPPPSGVPAAPVGPPRLRAPTTPATTPSPRPPDVDPTPF